MDFVTPSKEPMRADPPGFRVIASAWFRPDVTDRHRSPVFVAFTIVSGDRRAFAVARDPGGALLIQEYQFISDPDEGEPFAERIGGGPSPDPLINCIGDPLDAWIVGGHLPNQGR